MPKRDVIQTSCQRCAEAGGNHPQTHTLVHPKEPAPLIGVRGTWTGRDALLHTPRLQQRQAQLNKKKPPKPQEVHFYSSVSVPWDQRESPAKAADAWNVPYVPARQEEQLCVTLRSSFSHFWVVLRSRRNPQCPVRGPAKQRGSFHTGGYQEQDDLRTLSQPW